MVLRREEVDKAQKPPPVAAAAGPSFSIPFKNPRLRWGSTRHMLFQPVSGRRGPNDGHPPPPSHQSKNDRSGRFSVPFKNPMLRWGGSNHRTCCQVVSNHRDAADRRPSSASPSPPPTPHQTKNDPTLPPGRPRLVLRIPCPHQSKKNDPTPPPPGRPRLVLRIPCRAQAKVVPNRECPPPAPERRDHCQETGEAAAGGAPAEIARPVARPMTRCFRPEDGTQGEEKTAKKVRPAEFSISLIREEVMEDFIAMTGAKPTRLPKKRPRLLKNKLDEIFPGSGLPKIITPGRYSLR